MKGALYRGCVRSVLTYGAETWAIKSESVVKFKSTERRMIRMMCGVWLRDMVKSEELANRVGVGSMEEHLRVKRLRWYGHVMRRKSDVEIRKVFEMEVEERRGIGQPARRWIDLVNDDMKVKGVTSALVGDKERWRAAVQGPDNSYHSRENARYTNSCCLLLLHQPEQWTTYRLKQTSTGTTQKFPHL